MIGLFLLITTLDHLPTVWPAIREPAAAIVSIAVFVCLGLSVLARLTGHSAGERNRWWYRVSWTAFGLAIGLILLRLLSPALQTAQQSAVDAEEARWTVHNIGSGCTLSAPATWEPTVSPGDLRSLFLVHASRDVQLVAIAVPKIDLSARSVEELQQATMSTLQITDPEIQTREIRIGGQRTAIETEVVGTVQNIGRVLYRFRHQESRNVWIEIQVWGVPSQMIDDRDTVDRILASVTLEE